MEPRSYYLKVYRRTRPFGTVGELISTQEIIASGLALAQLIAIRDFLPSINFQHDFVILEGDTGFVKLWLMNESDADGI